MKKTKKEQELEKEIKYLKSKSNKNSKRDIELGYMEWLDLKEKTYNKKKLNK